jgi:uncharacterized protein (DUF305 family)
VTGADVTAEERADDTASRDGATRFGPIVAGTAVVALVLGVLLGWLVFSPRHPGDDSAEAGFARDMYEHHAQAVDMSLTVLQRTDDEAVRGLAYDIATSQANQMGQMEAWIRTWGLSMARPGPRMAWMGHEGHEAPEGAPMPGMATQEELEQLAAAEGEEAEILFLQLMTTHHIAGVEMADAALELADEPEVLRLARAMSNAQGAEIRLMAEMLAERGSQTREDVSAFLDGEAPAGHGDHEGDTTPSEDEHSEHGDGH